jgi:hypothetical protein
MMVFAVLHSANTECCSSRLLKPDADIILAQTCSLLAARPQVAVLASESSEALRVGNMCPDRNLVTDWTWTAYTLAQTRHGGYTERQLASMLATRRTVQPAVQLRIAVS